MKSSHFSSTQLLVLKSIRLSRRVKRESSLDSASNYNAVTVCPTLTRLLKRVTVLFMAAYRSLSVLIFVRLPDRKRFFM